MDVFSPITSARVSMTFVEQISFLHLCKQSHSSSPRHTRAIGTSAYDFVGRKSLALPVLQAKQSNVGTASACGTSVVALGPASRPLAFKRLY